jgi:protein-S-isoprenylcysteine O-methyltransferase Ste14
MNLPTSRDRPKVKVMPPLVFFAFLIGAAMLEYWLPVEVSEGLIGLRRLIAGSLLLFAGYLAIHAWLIFLKSGTHVDPRKPALKIIEEGPFRISRNPMYLSLVIIFAALAVLQLSIWFLLSCCGLWFILDRKAVVPEEAYLEAKFGDLYNDYKSRVRRWI